MAGQAQVVETLLSQLLQPDTTLIQQATQQLKQLIKDADIIPSLCTVLTTSQNVQVRKYAAVLLRRRILKASYWNNQSEQLRSSIKQNVLQVLLQETEKTVRNSLSQVVATVAKHELNKKRDWNELFDFLERGAGSQEHAEVTMLVLSSVTGTATEQLKPKFVPILRLLAAALKDGETVDIKYYALRSLTNIVPYIGSAELKGMQQLVPLILTVLEQLIQADQEKAVEGFEILEELLESETGIIVPHIRANVDFCLRVASLSTLDDAVRVKALSFLCCLTRLKRKAILNLKLSSTLVNAVFPIMCEAEEENDQEFEEAEAHTAPSYAAQVIDSMALHLPPEKFITLLMGHLEEALTSTNPCHRKAAYISMGVVSEGCADHLRNKYLKQLLQCAYKGVADSEKIVRHAALFALGQFSEHLQPDISAHAVDILPLVFNYLASVSPASDGDHKGITKTYYALEMFCENLGVDIVPYLPTLMQHLLSTLTGQTSSKSKELCISAIGATVNAAKDEIMPYFPQIIEHLKGFLQSGPSEDALKLQIQAIDTLAVISRSISKEHFIHLAPECVQLGITLLSQATDPDLKRCIYGLLSALSCLLQEEMGPYLETIVRAMLDSLRSTDGVVAHYALEESAMMNLFEEDEEDLEDTEDEDSDTDDIQGLSVENSYLDEKEDACTSLGELAENTRSAFMPYFEESFAEIQELVDSPSPCIRKAACEAASSYCCGMHAVWLLDKSAQNTKALQMTLTKTVSLILKMVQEDQERQVAMAALECLTSLLRKVEVMVLEVATVQQVMNCVLEVMHGKVASQDQDDLDIELEQQEAEYDSALLEHAGDVGPLVAKLIGGAAFYPYFATIAPVLLKKLKSGATVADKSFAVGTLAEFVEACGADTGPLVPHLYTTFSTALSDDDCEVRSNSVFGLGVLAGSCHQALKDQLPHILNKLVDILGKESDKRVVDNVAAAACRLIMTGEANVPTDQVLPVVIQCLPLKEDLDENKTVYECVANVYKAKPELVLQSLPSLLTSTCEVLQNKDVDTETKCLLGGLLQDMQTHHPEVWQSALISLPQEVTTSLSCFFASMTGCS